MNPHLFSIDWFPSLKLAGWFIDWSLFMETQLGPGESALCCCSGLQLNTHTAVTQTNDGVTMFHCWTLRWTTVTNGERSSSYLLTLLWRPCCPDRLVLEVWPTSSLSSFIVDWRPGYKHNYILFLWILFEYRTNYCSEDFLSISCPIYTLSLSISRSIHSITVCV